MENRDFVLKSLLQNTGGYVSGGALCARLGITRAAVWKIIGELRGEGYEIEAKSRLGYRLAVLPDRLDRLELETACPGWSFAVIDEVTSTNTLARGLADDGAGDRTAVIANSQTKGRGRFSRSFESKQDMGLWISVLLRPKCRPDEAVLFTIMAAVALNNAFERLTGKRAGIKWVNDLMFEDKKAVGILTETSIEGETGNLRHLVIGTGVNLLQEETDFSEELRGRAISLKTAAGMRIRRAEMAAAFLSEIDALYHDGDIADRQSLMRDYRNDLNMLGVTVIVQPNTGGESFRARAVDIDQTGSLIVEREDGTQVILSSGEISVRPI